MIVKINLNDARIQELKNIKSGNLSNSNSLFDRTAYVDYARYVNTSKWTEYKKDNDQFTTNSDYVYDGKIPKPSKMKDDNTHDLELTQIIKWSEKYPALQLRFQDFAYCKLLGYYPNNRLIVLRRFKGGVPDNLFDYYQGSDKGGEVRFSQPLSTMVSWLRPDVNIIQTLTFNENWVEHDSSLFETIKDAISESEGKQKGKKRQILEDTATMLSLDTLSKVLGERVDGVPFSKSFEGNPNLVSSAMKRKTGGGKDGGLSSSIKFDLEFEYELRYINGIDPSIAMLDLISNAMRMGTSEAEFKFNIPFLMTDPTINKILHGDTSTITTEFFNKISKMTTDIQSELTTYINNSYSVAKSIFSADNIKTGLNNVATKIIEYIISRYREDLKAALSVDTGLASGIWHVTIGNPMIPIVSCGDLIVSSSTLDMGTELGFNDFPNSFKIKYSLTSARERGRQELIRIFNSGRGRFYVYPNASDNPDHDLYKAK